jgi:hypothetical protein
MVPWYVVMLGLFAYKIQELVRALRQAKQYFFYILQCLQYYRVCVIE